MNCGEKIAELRKANNMTQADLGARLNVTFQAVSKWERGESYPDFETMLQIANIFHVKAEYFSADGQMEAEEVVDVATENKVMRGVCTVCGKVIYEGEEGESSPALLCKDCVTRRKLKMEREAAEKRKQQQLEEKRQREAKSAISAKVRKRRNIAFILAAIVTVAVLVGGIVAGVLLPNVIGIAIGCAIGGAVFFFAFMSQVIWGGVVQDIALTGGKIIGTPGIIFTFDLDGFIFLIGMKILFAVLKFLIFAITSLFFVLVAFIISPFTFVPSLININTDIAKAVDRYE